MPWTAADAKEKKSDLTDKEAEVWARIANDALKRCQGKGGDTSGCEASAIRIAHSTINKIRSKSKESAMSEESGFGIVKISETLSLSSSVIQEGFNDTDRSFSAKLIVAGRSLNQTFYSPINLAEMKVLIEGSGRGRGRKKMYVDHKYNSEGKLLERGVKEWGATVKEVTLTENNGVLTARVQVTPHNSWIYDLAKEQPSELGISVVHAAVVEKCPKDAGDGMPGIKIKQVVSFYSADFVCEPAAGGGIITESVNGEEFNVLLALARKAANANKDEELISIVESLSPNNALPSVEEVPKTRSENSDKENFAIDKETGKAIPFSDVLDKQKKMEDSYHIWWSFNDYCRALIFVDEEVDNDVILKAIQEAVKLVVPKIRSLIASKKESIPGALLATAGPISVKAEARRLILMELASKGLFKMSVSDITGETLDL